MELDLKKLQEYLDCDQEFLLEIIETFREEAVEIIEILEQGILNEDSHIINYAAHKMISTLRIFGFKKLITKFESIELATDADTNTKDLLITIDDALSLLKNRLKELDSIKEKLQ
jgi:HPt (histidine-containing phosphotransfer) domain-containing protein